MAETVSSISDFYNDRSIFVTGANGFMGKVLLEKLLWSCDAIKAIFILIRSKKNKTPCQRFEELLQSQVFDRLKAKKPEAISKLAFIEGDMLQQGLGISESDELFLIENVSIVFNFAATVKFNETLKRAVDMNVLGTRRIIDLCHKMKKLKALVHISTAYSNCNRGHIDEVVYELPYSHKKVIDVVEWLGEKSLDKLTTDLLEGRPNTYTYTKALAENLVLEESGSLPIAIVRPTIVSPSWKEPFPGWMDNIRGATGVIYAIAKGALRSLLCDTSITSDLIPVDVVTNIVIAVAWFTALQRSNHISVYNCSSSSTNPVTWRTVQRLTNLLVAAIPASEIIFYPYCIFTSCDVWHKFTVALYHYIPAYLFDFITVLRGHSAMAVLEYNKLHSALKQLEYFTTHEFTFDSTNVLELFQKLCPKDKKEFYFDIKSLDWPIFMMHYGHGVRKYLLKEEPFTIPSARKKLKRVYIYTMVWQTFLWFIIIFMISTVYKVLISMLESHS